MPLPLSLWDINLWLAITAIILLLTSEILSPYYGRATIWVDNNRLRTVSQIVGILFLSTVTITILKIILYPYGHA